MDKIPRNSNEKLVIIDDLTVTPKSNAVFYKSVIFAPSTTQCNVEGQKQIAGMCFQRCVWSGGRGGPPVLLI